MAVAFDTHRAVKTLEAAGTSTPEAEALVQIIGAAINGERVTKADVEEIGRGLEGFATKEDFERFATKEDLERFATKEDLKGFATKEDLERFATKEDLEVVRSDVQGLKREIQGLKQSLVDRELRLLKWTFGMLTGSVVFTVGLTVTLIKLLPS